MNLAVGTNSTTNLQPGSESFIANLAKMKLATQVSSLMTCKSTIIENKGDIAGSKLEQENALNMQSDNEDEYKKEHKHKILHAIISVFAHIINLVMIVVRPAKTIAKSVAKTAKKAVNKAAGKTAKKGMQHVAEGMEMHGKKGHKMHKPKKPAVKHNSVRHSVEHNAEKKLAEKGVNKPGKFRKFMQSDIGNTAKRITLVNGVTAGLNGIGDSASDIQIAKIQKDLAHLEQNNDLINSNSDIFASTKEQLQETLKENMQSRIDRQKALSDAINKISNMQAAVTQNVA